MMDNNPATNRWQTKPTDRFVLKWIKTRLSARITPHLVSYSSTRADSLGLNLGKPTLASKGTRMSVMIVCAVGGVLWPPSS